MKKRASTLLEVLIALSLTAILLTTLFSFFVESMKMEKKFEKSRDEVMGRLLLQTRLQTVFSAIDPDAFSFYTKEKDLILVFDQGIDPDPDYSGKLIGRLYIDEKKSLCLALWPLTDESPRPWRKEILLKDVEGMKFSFLGDNSAPEKEENVSPIDTSYAWRSMWPKSRAEPPSIIRLYLSKKDGEIPFAFFLPKAEPLITYKEKL